MGSDSFPSVLQPYSAVVLGATGNVGREIVSLLVASPAVKQVVVVNRRQTDTFKSILKLREVVVPDMDKLAEVVEAEAKEVDAKVAFCTIGVGRGSGKMPASDVRKIEVQYPESFAKGCRAGGVVSLGLLTAAGADSHSTFSYARIIGEKEKAVSNVGMPALGIYKPSIIFGNSNTPSYLHRLFPAVQWALPSRYHSIHKGELARAMVGGTQMSLVELVQDSAPRIKSYEYRDMQPFF